MSYHTGKVINLLKKSRNWSSFRRSLKVRRGSSASETIKMNNIEIWGADVSPLYEHIKRYNGRPKTY